MKLITKEIDFNKVDMKKEIEYYMTEINLSLIADENAYDENFWKRVKERSKFLCDRLEKEEQMQKSTTEQYTKEFEI